MTEAIYKVGDILEFTEVVPRQFGLWAGPVRGLVVKISDPGYEYLSYRLLLSGTVGTTKNMTLNWAFEKDIIPAAKRVGHIDISALLFMENDEPDYEKMVTACAFITAGNLRKLLDEETLKRKQAEAECEEKTKENERLSYENSDLKALNDELRKQNVELVKKLKEKVDQVCQLEKENEDIRLSNKKLSESLSNLEMKAHSRLDEISFLMRKVNELEDENARYFQSMTCVEKQLNEATKRIQAAMEHLDVAFCDNE